MEGEVELEVIGRHAMLFDDDTNAAFVNSNEALVEWNNSLFIDRYDVRHLLSNPPSSFRKLTRHSSSPPPDSQLESQLDLERYADLPSSASSDQPEVETEVEAKDTTAFHAVPFSYGTSADSTDQKTSDVAMDTSTFHPSFPVPESLLQNLPPTEKLHQIIARTAIFVGKHGAQSEIVLRVKQGDNPTFGFLMPHHHLHPYFRYLVDHPQLLEADNDSKSQDEKAHENQASGALSLLGSVYGSGEDDDGSAEADRESKQLDSGGTSTVGDMPNSQQLEQSITSGNVAQTDEKSSKLVLPSKVKATALSKNRIFNIKPAYANGMKKDGDIMGSTGLDINKSKAPCLFPIPKVEISLVDPPSEVKRLVDRIVEIILKNGKDFEAVLIEQDKKHGKFPFLLPSNQYHPYYLKALKKAHESRLTGKSFGTEKDGLSRQEMDKKTASIKESDFSALESGPHDLSLDHDRKEKFKMVIKSRKDSQDQPSKETQQQCGVSVDAAAAAAILQAATRGIKKPNLDIFSKTALNGTNHGSSNEGAPVSSASLQTSQAQSSGIKQNENRKPSVTVPVAKEIAKTAALAAAGEADSSEAGMTREQKLKAERLRRAKMFAAMIKSGKEPLRGSPAEPPGSGVSGSGADIGNEVVKEREDTSVPVEAGNSNKREKLEINSSDDENEHKSRKKRHYRSRKHNDSEGEDEDEVKKDEEDRRHFRKKHRSHRSSRHHRDRSRDKHKHRRRHSSKSKESRHRHKHKDSSSEDDDRHHRHKHDSFSEDEHSHHKQRHNHDSSSEDEHRHHKRRHNHDSSSEDERKHHKRRHKRSRKDEDKHEGKSRKVERSHDEVELEEGEIRTKSSDQSPSAIGDDVCGQTFVDVSTSSDQEKRTQSVPPSESTEVPDELRAKIRAMLLATM